MLTIKGFRLNVLGKDIVVSQKPMFPVGRFISAEEFDRNAKNIMCKYSVKEGLRTLDGGIVIVHYVKAKL